MIKCLACGKEFDIIIHNVDEEAFYMLRGCPLCWTEDSLDSDEEEMDIIIGIDE